MRALQLFKLEYEQISAGIRSRDNGTVITGSIFITISLILLGTLLEIQLSKGIDYRTRISFIGIIMAIYSVWFVCVDLTSVRLNNLQYQRLVKMEVAKEFRLHRFMSKQVRDKRARAKWLTCIRRLAWLYSFYALTTRALGHIKLYTSLWEHVADIYKKE